jgi:NADH-quinone oxidoreductase subunit J
MEETLNLGETIVFWITGTLAVIGGIGMIVSRKAVHSALFIALTMINLAVLYVANSAPFLGMVQVIVYTGAVMMLFLFVLMVVGVDSSDSLVETIRGQRVAALVLGIGLGLLLTVGIGSALVGTQSIGLQAAEDAAGGNVQGLAQLIFDDYVIAFQATAALLITAAVGAMVLAHRERWAPRKNQRQLAEERVATGAHLGNAPNPGVYARHNAVDTPALLPDGSTSLESVPLPLRARDDVRPVDDADMAEVRELSKGEDQ